MTIVSSEVAQKRVSGDRIRRGTRYLILSYRVTGGPWRKIELGDVLAEHLVELRGP